MNRLVAFILLVLLSPFFLLISMVQLLVFKNVIFVQNRIGRNEKPFYLFKFQTMNPPGKGNEQSSLNSWGKFLRRFGIDEWPQLINVLNGDMNFVGPRPLLPQYLELYNEEQKKRHLVKPGITGWAQVKGRNNLSWAEQFKLDVWYVEHQSFFLDVKIVLLTFLKLLNPTNPETKLREPFNGGN